MLICLIPRSVWDVAATERNRSLLVSYSYRICDYSFSGLAPLTVGGSSGE